MHTLLEQEAPELTQKLKLLSPEKQQELLRKACYLVSQCLDIEPPVQKLLDDLAAYTEPSPTKGVNAASLAEAADEEYLQLEEQKTDPEKALDLFSKARFLTAISIAFSSPTAISALDGIYELLKSCSDTQKLIEFLENSSRGS